MSENATNFVRTIWTQKIRLTSFCLLLVDRLVDLHSKIDSLFAERVISARGNCLQSFLQTKTNRLPKLNANNLNPNLNSKTQIQTKPSNNKRGKVC